MIPVTRYFFSTAEALADGSPGKIFLLYRIIPAREFYVPGNDDTEIRTVTSEEDMDDDNEMAVGDPFFQVEGCTAEGWDKAEVVLACEVAEENAANTLRKMGAVECTDRARKKIPQAAELICVLEKMGVFKIGGDLCTDILDRLECGFGELRLAVMAAEEHDVRLKRALELIPEAQ